MNHIMSHLKDFVGFNDPLEYEYDNYDDELERLEYRDHYPDYPDQYQEEYRQSADRESQNSYDYGMRERAPLARREGLSSKNNVIRMPDSSNRMSEVVVLEPRSFEEIPQVIQSLREHKAIVLNLASMDPNQAQRAVDFAAGGTYAIDGHQEKIGEGIFLFTPRYVQINTPKTVENNIPTDFSAVRTPHSMSFDMR